VNEEELKDEEPGNKKRMILGTIFNFLKSILKRN
jgi:hypothetical protein